MDDLESTDARKLLAEYRFHRESSLRSKAQSLTNQGLTTFIVGISILSIAYEVESIIGVLGAIALSRGGALYLVRSSTVIKNAQNMAEENDKLKEKLIEKIE